MVCVPASVCYYFFHKPAIKKAASYNGLICLKVIFAKPLCSDTMVCTSSQWQIRGGWRGGDGFKPPPFLSTVPVPHSREIFASCCDNGHKGVAPIDVHPAVAVNQPAAPDECCFLCEQ